MTRDIFVDPSSPLCHLVTLPRPPFLECQVLFEWLLTEFDCQSAIIVIIRGIQGLD